MDDTAWKPPPAGLSRWVMVARGFAATSFGFLFIAYIGWLADVVVGPVAFAISAVAVIRAVRRAVDRAPAFGALALSSPAFAWAVYALAGGRF